MLGDSNIANMESKEYLLKKKINELRSKEEELKQLIHDLKIIDKSFYAGLIEQIDYYNLKNIILNKINELDLKIHEDIAYIRQLLYSLELLPLERKVEYKKRNKTKPTKYVRIIDRIFRPGSNKNIRSYQANIETKERYKEDFEKFIKEYEVKLSPIVKQVLKLYGNKKSGEKYVKVKRKQYSFQHLYGKRPNYYKLLVRISNKLFYSFIDKVISTYPSLYRTIKTILKAASIRMTVRTFLSVLLFIYLITSLITASIIFIFTRTTIFSFIGVAIETLIFLILLLYIPNYRKKSIENEVLNKLPFVILNMSILAKSDISPIDVIRVIAESKEYGYITQEFQRLLYYSETLGMGLLLAIKKVSDTTSSKMLKEFLDELYLSLSSGVSFKEFLRVAAETAIIQYKSNNDKFIQALKTFSDLYVGLVVTVPIILVSVIIMLSSLSESLFSLPISKVVNIIVYGIVPAINIMAIYLISRLIPK